MSDAEQALAEGQKVEAIHAAAVAQEASQKAHESQMLHIVSTAVSQAIKEVFDTGTKNKRFVDVSQIPLICQSIVGIHKEQKEMKESILLIQEKLDENYVTKEAFWPVKALVYGFVAIILTAVVVALIALVVITPR